MSAHSFSLFSPHPIAVRTPSQRAWKLLLLTGLSCAAYAERYDVFSITSTDDFTPNSEPAQQVFAIDGDLWPVEGDYSSSDPEDWHYFRRWDNASSTYDHPSVAAEPPCIYFVSSAIYNDSVDILLSPTDSLKLHNNLSNVSIWDDLRTVYPRAQSATATLFTAPGNSGNNYLYNANLRIDASIAGGYTISVPIELESLTQLDILTSDNAASNPSGSVVNLQGALTGSGTLKQVGILGHLELGAQNDAFYGTISIEKKIQPQELLVLKSLVNGSGNPASPGVLSFEDLAPSIVSREALRFNGGVAGDVDGQWSANVSILKATGIDGSSNPYIDPYVSKENDGALTASSTSEFYGGFHLNGGSVILGASSTLADAMPNPPLLTGPLGSSHIDIAPSGTLNMSGYDLHNALNVQGIVSNDAELDSHIAFESVITIWDTASFQGDPRAEGELYIYGKIVSGEVDSGSTPTTASLNIRKGVVHLKNMQTSPNNINTYGGSTNIYSASEERDSSNILVDLDPTTLVLHTVESLGPLNTTDASLIELAGDPYRVVLDLTPLEDGAVLYSSLKSHMGTIKYAPVVGDGETKKISAMGTISGYEQVGTDLTFDIGGAVILEWAGEITQLRSQDDNTVEYPTSLIKKGNGDLQLSFSRTSPAPGSNRFSSVDLQEGSIKLTSFSSSAPTTYWDNGTAAYTTGAALSSSGLGIGPVTIASETFLNLNGYNMANPQITLGGLITIEAGEGEIASSLSGGLISEIAEISSITLEGELAGLKAMEGATLFVKAPISGSAPLATSGEGVVALAGANTFSGLLDVTSGTVQSRVAATLLTVPSPEIGSSAFGVGSVHVATGATLDLYGYDLYNAIEASGRVTNSSTSQDATIHSSAAITLGGGNEFSSASKKLIIDAIMSGAQDVAMNIGGAGTVVISGAQSFAGGLNIVSGTVEAGSAGALGHGAVTVSSQGVLDLNGWEFAAPDTGITELVLSGTLQNTKTSVAGGVTEYIPATMRAPIILNASATIRSSSPIIMDSIVSGSGVLNKTGDSSLTLKGANTLTGLVVLGGAGSVILEDSGSLGSHSGVAVNTTLDFRAISASSLSLHNLYGSASGVVTMGNKDLQLTATSAQFYSGSFSSHAPSVLDSVYPTITVAPTTGGSYTFAGDNTAFLGHLVVQNTGLALENSMQVTGLVTEGGGSLSVSAGKYIKLKKSTATQALESYPIVISGAGSFVFEGSSSADGAIIGSSVALTGDLKAETLGILSIVSQDVLNSAGTLHVTGSAQLDLSGLTFGGDSSPEKILTMVASVGHCPIVFNTSSSASTLIEHIALERSTEDVFNAQYRFNGGDVGLSVNTITQATGESTIQTSSRVTFGSDVIFGSQADLQVLDGMTWVRGEIRGAAQIFNGAQLALEGGYQDSAKLMGAEFEGDGSLEIYGGWVALTGAISDSADGVLDLIVRDEGSYFGRNLGQATLSVTDLYTATGAITVDGILIANLESDRTWGNRLSGEGLLKKYGAGTLKLSGDLAAFTGGMAIYEGIVESSSPLSVELEVYAGATLLSGLITREGQTSSIGGDLFGYIENNGTLRFGNHTSSGAVQIIDADSIRGDGDWVFENKANVRMRAADPRYASDLSSVDIQGATLSLSGRFERDGNGPGPSRENLWVHEGGTLVFEPNSSYQGSLYVEEDSLIRMQGFNIDHPVLLTTGPVTIGTGSTLDIAVDYINTDPSTMFMRIDSLVASSGSKLVLRPDSAADLVSGEPLLKVAALTIEDTLPLKVIPRVGFNGRLIETTTFKLMELTGNYTEISLRETQNKLLANVQTNGLYTVMNPRFEGTMLLCDLEPLSIEDFLISPIFQGLPEEYQGVARAILENADSANAFTHSFIERLGAATTTEEIQTFIRNITPTLAADRNTSLLKSQSYTATNIIRVIRNQGVSMSLMGEKQGPTPAFSLGGFMRQSSKIQLQGDLLSKKVAKAVDPGTQIRMQDFSHVDLNGLTLSSETSYAHQNTQAQSDDNPGTTQSSWSTSLAGLYSKCQKKAIGAIATTTKTIENLNANQMNKTMKRSDRYNTGGVMGLVQVDGQPWYLSGVLTYGQHNYEMTRTWDHPVENNEVINSTAVSKYNGYELYVTTEAGYKTQLNESSVLQPYVGYVLSRLSTQGYTESSSNTEDGSINDYGIVAQPQKSVNIAVNAGIELVKAVKSEGGAYQVLTRMGVTTQKNHGDASTVNYVYLGDRDASYAMETTNQRYNTLDLSFGVHAAIGRGLALHALYTGNYGSKGNTHTAMVNVEYVL